MYKNCEKRNNWVTHIELLVDSLRMLYVLLFLMSQMKGHLLVVSLSAIKKYSCKISIEPFKFLINI